MEIPKYLQQPHEPPTEIQQKHWDLEDEYVKRHGIIGVARGTVETIMSGEGR